MKGHPAAPSHRHTGPRFGYQGIPKGSTTRGGGEGPLGPHGAPWGSLGLLGAPWGPLGPLWGWSCQAMLIAVRHCLTGAFFFSGPNCTFSQFCYIFGQPRPAWASPGQPRGLGFPSPVDRGATLPRRGVFFPPKMHFLAHDRGNRGGRAPLGPGGSFVQLRNFVCLP